MKQDKGVVSSNRFVAQLSARGSVIAYTPETSIPAIARRQMVVMDGMAYGEPQKTIPNHIPVTRPHDVLDKHCAFAQSLPMYPYKSDLVLHSLLAYHMPHPVLTASSCRRLELCSNARCFRHDIDFRMEATGD